METPPPSPPKKKQQQQQQTGKQTNKNEIWSSKMSKARKIQADGSGIIILISSTWPICLSGCCLAFNIICCLLHFKLNCLHRWQATKINLNILDYS